MKEIICNTQRDNQHMTSLEIARVTGKQHFHVMEAIRKMEPAWIKIAASKFGLGSYKKGSAGTGPLITSQSTRVMFKRNQ